MADVALGPAIRGEPFMGRFQIGVDETEVAANSRRDAFYQNIIAASATGYAPNFHYFIRVVTIQLFQNLVSLLPS